MAKMLNRRHAAQSLARICRNFRHDDSGATAIEYSLIVGLIFLAIVGSIRSYTETTSVMYDELSTTISEATD
jgi:pilus assembly protein Flp/PilA